MNNLQAKVAVITCGNSGIGNAAAKELKAQGAVEIITDRKKETVEQAAAEMNAGHYITDQANLHDIDWLCAGIRSQYGKIDILLINAGISNFASIESTSESMFDDIMNGNVKGAYFMLSKFIPLLNEQASVIPLSSTAATTPTPNISVYASSKAALNAMVKVAALEMAPRKIRINPLSPGPIATEIMEQSGISDPESQQNILGGIPLSWFGKPQEVARMIAFLSGNDAGFITGAELIMDDGQSL